LPKLSRYSGGQACRGVGSVIDLPDVVLSP
jgi:hypothetical protein